MNYLCLWWFCCNSWYDNKCLYLILQAAESFTLKFLWIHKKLFKKMCWDGDMFYQSAHKLFLFTKHVSVSIYLWIFIDEFNFLSTQKLLLKLWRLKFIQNLLVSQLFFRKLFYVSALFIILYKLRKDRVLAIRARTHWFEGRGTDLGADIDRWWCLFVSFTPTCFEG